MTTICLIAGSQEEAYRYARSQNLSREQWFHPDNANDLLFRSNFHVIVVGEHNFPFLSFEKIYKLALERGKVDRI